MGLLIGIYLTFVKLVLGESIGTRPLLSLAILLVVLGVQMLSMGLLAEMITRTYHEAQDKPIYAIREQLDSPVPLQAGMAAAIEDATRGFQ